MTRFDDVGILICKMDSCNDTLPQIRRVDYRRLCQIICKTHEDAPVMVTPELTVRTGYILRIIYDLRP